MFTEGEKNGNERRKKSEKEEMNERVILKVFFIHFCFGGERKRGGSRGWCKWFFMVFVGICVFKIFRNN